MEPRTKKHPVERHLLFPAIEGFVQAGLRPVADLLIKLIKFHRRNEPAHSDLAPIHNPKLPTGPYLPGEIERKGSLILYVPRNIFGWIIDHSTGRRGYSHVTVDCGEIDAPTGKRVMIESYPETVVHHAFQDEYGDRPYLRIPLAQAGVDVDDFCDCIRSKLGEKYDDAEALTWGALDDPTRQVCSNLATVCLPVKMQADIAEKHRRGLISRTAVSLHGNLRSKFRLFVSPNGFAEYFQAPKSKDVDSPDQLFVPTAKVGESTKPVGQEGFQKSIWTAGFLMASSLAIGYLVFRGVKKAKIGHN